MGLPHMSCYLCGSSACMAWLMQRQDIGACHVRAALFSCTVRAGQLAS